MSDETIETAPAKAATPASGITFIKEEWSKEIPTPEFKAKFGENFSILSVPQSILASTENGVNHWDFVMEHSKGYISIDGSTTSKDMIEFLFESIQDKMMMEAYFKSIELAEQNKASGEAQSSK